VGGLLPLVIAVTGCDSYGEIREGLSEPERARFDSGMRQATACWSCHDVTGEATNVGPPLRGLFGRRAGTLPEYPYSEALRASQVVWNRRSLDAFLANVQGFVPGNRMLSGGVPSAGARADLIFFLEHVTRTRVAGP
jgi:cytochrome c